MPIPFLLLGAAVYAGVEGVKDASEAKQINSEAEAIVERAKDHYDRAISSLEKNKERTNTQLEKLGELKLDIWSNDLNEFLQIFEAFNHVDVNDNLTFFQTFDKEIDTTLAIKNMEKASTNALEIVQIGIASLGAGALVGIAVYGGAMMFAAASTGTAIATLSGIAATNATLAWFGGGALAMGGLGMAAGKIVLGGIVIGPILAVAGSMMKSKSEENLAQAKNTNMEVNEAITQINSLTDYMNQIQLIVYDYMNFIEELRKVLRRYNSKIKTIRNNAIINNYIMGNNMGKIDFDDLSTEDQKTLQIAWMISQVMYSILSAPILDQESNINFRAQEILRQQKNHYNSIKNQMWS